MQRDKHGKKRTVITLWIFAVVGVLAIVAMIVYFTSPAYNTIQALKSNDPAKATDHYTKVEGKVLQEKLFMMLLPDVLEEINDTYNNEASSTEDTQKVYEAILTFDQSQETLSSYDQFRALEQSKKFYDIAYSFMEESDYINAMLNYKNVIEEDTNYGAAQSNAALCEGKYVEEIETEFHSLVRDGDIGEAEKLLNTALTIVSSSTLEKLGDNLASGVYNKINFLLEQMAQWETITPDHGGENYRCFRIEADTNNFGIKFLYMMESWIPRYQSGKIIYGGGPVQYYFLKNSSWEEMDYSEIDDWNFNAKKHIMDWDYTMSKEEKFEVLEELLCE